MPYAKFYEKRSRNDFFRATSLQKVPQIHPTPFLIVNNMVFGQNAPEVWLRGRGASILALLYVLQAQTVPDISDPRALEGHFIKCCKSYLDILQNVPKVIWTFVRMSKHIFKKSKCPTLAGQLEECPARNIFGNSHKWDISRFVQGKWEILGIIPCQ